MKQLVYLGILVFIMQPIQAVVFQYGWNWFIEPLCGIRLGFWMALGLGALARFVCSEQIVPKEYDDDIQMITVIVRTFLAWIVMLVAHNYL